MSFFPLFICAVFSGNTEEPFVDDFGVEFEDNSKRNLTSTSSVVVDYEVPSSCVVINGGTSADESSFRSSFNSIKTLRFQEGSQLSCIYPFVFSGSSIECIDFSNCQNLLIINSSICRYCSKLNSLTLPPKCTTINEYAFRECTSLTSIELPNSIEVVGSYAFSMCLSITEVIINSNSQLREFQNDCFSYINATSLFIPKNFEIFAGACLYNTHILEFIIDKSNKYFSTDGTALFNLNQSIIYYIPNGKTGTYKVPPTVKQIATAALRFTNFSSFELPDDLEDIGIWAAGQNYNIQEFTFPSKIKEIRQRVLKECQNLRKIIIQGNVSRIYDGAFSMCPNLQEITLPSSLISLGKEVFYGDTSLTEVNLPSSLYSVGGYCFALCPNLVLTSESQTIAIDNDNNLLIYNGENSQVKAFLGTNKNVKIPSGMQSIGAGAFQFTTIETITFEDDTLTVIEAHAFANSSLKSISFPTSLTTIYNNAFESCINLISINISDTQVTNISDYTFYNCTSLTTFTISHSSLTQIGEYAFAETTQLSEFKFGITIITSIGSRAFQNSGIQAVYFSYTLQTLGVSSFQGSKIQTLNFQNSRIQSIPWLCFADCTQLVNLTFNNSLTIIGEEAFCNCINLTQFKLPQKIKSIETKAFYGCLKLCNITFSLNCNLQTIKGQAFAKCPDLSAFDIPEGDDNFKFKDGVLLDKAQTKIFVYLPSSPNKIYVVPSRVSSINAYAFQQCNNLQAVIIPDGVLTSIGLYAFEGCEHLSYLYLPNSLETVGIRAFANCNNLKCGSVVVKEEKRPLVINRGVPSLVFNDYCPSNSITCKASVYNCGGLSFAIFIGIFSN